MEESSTLRLIPEDFDEEDKNEEELEDCEEVEIEAEVDDIVELEIDEPVGGLVSAD